MMDEVGAAQAQAEGLYAPLDAAAIPDMAKLYPQFRIAGDPYTKFMYVSQVIAYDKNKVTTAPQSVRGHVEARVQGQDLRPRHQHHPRHDVPDDGRAHERRQRGEHRSRLHQPARS